jgi:hypothetical protein
MPRDQSEGLRALDLFRQSAGSRSVDQLLVTETIKSGETVYVRGGKKAERGRDITRPGFFEMFKELHIHRQMNLLPDAYRTADARAYFDQRYEDCAASLLLPWLFGLKEEEVPIARG